MKLIACYVTTTISIVLLLAVVWYAIHDYWIQLGRGTAARCCSIGVRIDTQLGDGDVKERHVIGGAGSLGQYHLNKDGYTSASNRSASNDPVLHPSTRGYRVAALFVRPVHHRNRLAK